MSQQTHHNRPNRFIRSTNACPQGDFFTSAWQTRAGDVCRRDRGAADRRARARPRHEQVALLISADLFCCGLVTLIQSLGLRQWFRHQAAGDDGRDLRRGRADGGDGQRAGRSRAQAISARSSAPASVDAGGAFDEPHAALLPAGGDRHHHRDHRHQPDAGGRRAGRWVGGHLAQGVDVPKLVAMVDSAREGQRPPGQTRAAGAEAVPITLARSRWWTTPATARSTPWPVAGLGAGGDPAAGAFRPRLRGQHLGAAGHRGRLRGGGAGGQDGLREGRRRTLVRRGHALRLRACRPRHR